MSRRDEIDALIRRHLRVADSVTLTDHTRVSDLSTAQWRIVDLGIDVGALIGRPVPADEAVGIETVGGWRRLGG